MNKQKSVIQLIILLVFFLAAPFALTKYYAQLLTEILIWGILAMALDLILGYIGIISFGHAALFGLGAYGAAICLVKLSSGFWLALGIGLLAPVVFAIGVGGLSLYIKGAYFTIITLVAAEIVHTIALSFPIFGGENGLNFGVPMLNMGFFRISLAEPLHYYYFVLLFFLLSYFICRRITQSPMGKVFQALKDNEERAKAIGYDVRMYKIVAFVISGFFSGLSGILYVILQRYANPDFLHFIISGEAVIWTLIGGMGTLFGPVIGTGIVILLGDLLSTWMQNYLVVIGLIFIVAVIFLPKGIVGTIRNRWLHAKS
jgi:branched-chain amino acid transport system permease protein